VVATSVNPPKLYIFTDGGFPDVEGFSLGNLEPEVVVIGPQPPPYEPPSGNADVQAAPKAKNPSDNVAILALQSSRNEEKPDRYQVFGRVHNFRAEPVTTEAKLFRHDPKKAGDAGTLIDAIALKVEAQSDQAFKFDLEDSGSAELEVRLDVKDSLPVDNRAFTVFGNARKAQVLLVTPGTRYLIDTLKTPTTEQLADLAQTTPQGYETDAYTRDVAAGRYDLVIFDGYRPKTNPEANTLYLGALPPGDKYAKSTEVDAPVVADWDVAHPLMQYIRDIGQLRISKALVIEPPTGSKKLIESDRGPIAFVASRSGYEDAVLTFGLLDGKNFNTDWPFRYSFPLFLYNTLRVLGNARESAGNEVHAPDQPVTLRAESLTETVEVTSPRGNRDTLKRTAQGTFIYNDAKTTGIYHVRWGKGGAAAFAVNLFDSRESDLAPRGLVPTGAPTSLEDRYKIKIGYNPVKGTRRTAPAIKDWWKPVALLALGVVLLEWYIYNRRVYI
jgi:hypothetical protein